MPMEDYDFVFLSRKAAHIFLPHPQLGVLILTNLYAICAKITHFQVKYKDYAFKVMSIKSSYLNFLFYSASSLQFPLCWHSAKTEWAEGFGREDNQNSAPPPAIYWMWVVKI